MKRCWACGQEKPLDEFQRDRSRPDGRCGRCRECKNAAKRRYNAEMAWKLRPIWRAQQRRRRARERAA